MSYLLPPLNALRAFEVTARHGDFQHAARELRVTPGAVGQQVRALELLLGVALFEREHNRLLLTKIGRSYAATLGEAFARISDATADLRPAYPKLVVRLGIRAGLPLHGSGGLLTTIEGFRRTNDDTLSVAVRVSQPVGLGELLEGKIDAAILRGERRQAGICSRRLVRTTWGGDDDYLVAPEATRDCVEIDALYRWLAAADRSR
jgi:DNA-binding transcriptional LysR family regulator